MLHGAMEFISDDGYLEARQTGGFTKWGMVGESWFLCHPMEGYSMFYPQVMTISLRTGSHGPFMVDDLPKEIHWFQILTLPGIEGCLQVALRVGKPVAAIAQITGSRGCLKHSMEGICT